jgi:hypothetical protein
MNIKLVLLVILKILSNHIKLFFLLPFLIFYNIVLQAQWVQTNGPGVGWVNSIVINGTNIISGGSEGVYISSNNGTSWSAKNYGLPSGPRIYSLAVIGTNIFAGFQSYNSPGGVYHSTDYGSSWSASGLTNYTILSLAISDSIIFAGTDTGGVFLSTNNGIDWLKADNGLPNTSVYSLAVTGNNIFAGTWNGLFLSTNNGNKWTQVNDAGVFALTITGSNIFAGTWGGVLLSTNNGANWTHVNNGLIDSMIISLASSGNTLYAGARGWPYSGGVYRSTDNGENWKLVSLNGYMILSLATDGNRVFAGADKFGGQDNIQGVYFSNDNGASWEQIGLPITFIPSISISGDNIFACGAGGIFLSTNNGSNWEFNFMYGPVGIGHVTSNSSYIYAGSFGLGIFQSTDYGISWERILQEGFIQSLVTSETNTYAAISPGHLLHSTDNGKSWDSIVFFNKMGINCLALDGTNVYVGTNGNGVYLSTNNGINWTQEDTRLTNTSVNSIVTSGTNIFAGTNSGVFLSTNHGTNWLQINNGLTDTNIFSFAVSGTSVFAGTGSGVFQYIDKNWKQTGLNNMSIYSLAVNETFIFAGGDIGGVWKRPLSELVYVAKEENKVPKNYSLSQNYPNPFNPSTNIKYSIPKSSLVSIKVYSILGNEIKTLVNEEKPAGNYDLTWNASSLPSGVYFYRIYAGSFVETKKMILMK